MRGWLGACLALATAGLAAPGAAQFLPPDILGPVVVAARKLPPAVRLPTPEEAAKIAALEAQVRIDAPCNTTWQAELEVPRRQLLALYEATYGPAHPATVRPLYSLLCHLNYNGSAPAALAERKAISRRIAEIGQTSAQPVLRFAGLEALAMGPDWTVSDARAAFDLARRLWGSDSPITVDAEATLAQLLEGSGKPVDAEPFRQEIVTTLQRHPEREPFELAFAYENLGNTLTFQMRQDDAHAWFARAFGVYEGAVASAGAARLGDIVAYGQRLAWTDPPRAEALYRAVLARQEADPESSDRRNWMTLWNLAKSARVRHDSAAAIALQERVMAAVGPGPDNGRALELADLLLDRNDPADAARAEPVYRAELAAHPDKPEYLEQLGEALFQQNRVAEGIAVRERAVAIAVQRYGSTHRETLRLTQNLGVRLWILGQPHAARPYYEKTLAGYRAELASLPEYSDEAYRRTLRSFVSSKASDLVRLYWADRSDPVTAQADTRALAFAAVQYAHPSVSGAAINETAARGLAAGAGAGAEFAAWTGARDRLATLDKAIAEAVRQGAPADDERGRLLAERSSAARAVDAAAIVLKQRMPALFATLRPEAVPLTALTGAPGTAPLLRADEALVLVYPGMPEARAEMSRGIVFVVTREGSAWAEIERDGADLADAVDTLHQALADETFAGATARNASDDPAAFLRYDRALAFGVYRDLFGGAQTAALLAGKNRWIVVPEGPLLSLNLAALVTQQPEGGRRGDIDPDALRATHWLGLEKTLTVLPSVNALQLARSGGAVAASPALASTRFFGIGDPAFRGTADPPPKPPAKPASRGYPGRSAQHAASIAAKEFYRGGAADPAQIATLPRLDYSAAEVQRIGAALGAPPTRVLTQLRATQANLAARSSDGTLHDSGIVVFATHALLDGDFDGQVVEPALALTPRRGAAGSAPDPADDGLLTASEIAGLHFGAPLVVLSGCSTAAGPQGGEGLSGLVRAFFAAGARSILATHAPILDEAGERLTTATISGLGSAHGDVAAAMRSAMRDLAQDKSHDPDGASLAHPRAWAGYVVIDPS